MGIIQPMSTEGLKLQLGITPQHSLRNVKYTWEFWCFCPSPRQHPLAAPKLQCPAGITGLCWVSLDVVGKDLGSQERCFRTARNDQSPAFTSLAVSLSFSSGVCPGPIMRVMDQEKTKLLI